MNITLVVVLLSYFASAERQNLRGLKENKKNAVHERLLRNDYDGYYRTKSLKKGVRNLEIHYKKSKKDIQPSPGGVRKLGRDGKKGGYDGGVHNERQLKSLKKGVRDLENPNVQYPDDYSVYYGGKKGGNRYNDEFPVPSGGERNLGRDGKKGGYDGGVHNERQLKSLKKGVRNLENPNVPYPDDFSGYYYGGKKGGNRYDGESPVPPGGGRKLGRDGKKGGYDGGVHNERQLKNIKKGVRNLENPNVPYPDDYSGYYYGGKKGGNMYDGGVRNLGGYYGGKKGKYYN